MSITQSIIRMSVLPRVAPLPSPRSLPRDHDPAATMRSPPPRSLHLVVVLPMRRSASGCILQRSTPIGRSWITVRRIPWMWCISATSPATAYLKREAPIKDFGLSSIKIGTRLCYIQNHLQWLRSSMLILNTWGTRRTCTSIGYLKLVTCMVSLICYSLGTTEIKKSSLSSTPLSSMTRKRWYLCGWLMAEGSMWG
jgi:hypothetical protein